MKFVPVPGTKVLFCEHETRVQDYAAYAAANSGVDDEWKEYKSHQEADHPVINVNWDDAKAFCSWLSKKEGKMYRLPTDHEWSMAVGIGDQESASASPKEKGENIKGVYLWGTQFPPPKGAGNYHGSELEKSEMFSQLDGYIDRYALTAPVKTYGANKHGLYDLGGNVQEWCEDLWSNKHDAFTLRVLRGGSWIDAHESTLDSSFRFRHSPVLRFYYHGLRLVVVKKI